MSLKEQYEDLKGNIRVKDTDITDKIDRFLNNPMSQYFNHDSERILEFFEIYQDMSTDDTFLYLLERRSQTSNDPYDRSFYSVIWNIQSLKKSLKPENSDLLMYLTGLEVLTVSGLISNNKSFKSTVLNRVRSLKGGVN
jgi:hypothetical protein